MPSIHLLRPCLRIALLLPFVVCLAAQASVVLQGTRVIFSGTENEATLQMTNDGEAPALVQTWLEPEKEHAEALNTDVPFVITPTLARIDAGKGQTLRIIYSGEPLPQDKESLFWLNVLEVPPKSKASGENTLQFAYRTRIKLMYRPADLPKPQDLPGQLRWTLVDDAASGQRALKASNPSAYVVNFGNVSFKAAGTLHEAGAGYVLPGASAVFPIKQAPQNASTADARAVFMLLNDWGGGEAHEAALAP